MKCKFQIRDIFIVIRCRRVLSSTVFLNTESETAEHAEVGSSFHHLGTTELKTRTSVELKMSFSECILVLFVCA